MARAGVRRHRRPVAGLAVLCACLLLAGCGASDDRLTRSVLGTWGSVDVAPDDVIVETEFTLLPGGRMNWRGQLRLLVPADFTLPDRPRFEVRNGRLIYHFDASGSWRVKNGLLHTRIDASTLPGLMPVGFAAAWKIREVNGKEMIYESLPSGRTRVEYRRQP